MALGAAIVAGTQSIANKLNTTDGKTAIDTSVLKESMEENREHSTEKYLYANSITIKDSNDFGALGFDDVTVPFTEARHTLQYDGTIKAGFDLTQADVETDDATNTVIVTLPQPQILSHETENVELVDEQQNIANPPTRRRGVQLDRRQEG